jgi:hypothetical protein
MKKLNGKSTQSIIQPSQGNYDNMVKKFEKGAIAICFKCHKKGHKSYKCLQVNKMVKDKKKMMNFTIKNFLTYTMPNWRNER